MSASALKTPRENYLCEGNLACFQLYWLFFFNLLVAIPFRARTAFGFVWSSPTSRKSNTLGQRLACLAKMWCI